MSQQAHVADSAGPPTASTPPAAAMRFILLAVLLDMVAIGIIVPVLPALVGKLTGSQSDHAFWLGVISFSFGLANFFGAPLLGALSDRFGRRPILLLGFCGLALNFLATAAATALWMLIVVRLLAGAMQANAAVANAYVADITPAHQRAQRFGLLGAMFGIGFVLGPAAGGLLGDIDLRLPFLAAGLLALANLAYGYFVLPESLKPDSRKPFSWSAANPIESFKRLARHRDIGLLVGVLACTSLAQGILYNSWVLYTTFKFGWGPSENGASLAAVGIMSIIVQGFLLGRLLKRFSARRLALMGLASSCAAYALWGLAPTGGFMVGVIFFNLLGFTVNASIQGLVSSAVDNQEQGRTLGTVVAINSLMAVVAPLVAAPIFMAVSHYPVGDWRIGAALLLGAALQAVAFVLAWIQFKNKAVPT